MEKTTKKKLLILLLKIISRLQAEHGRMTIRRLLYLRQTKRSSAVFRISEFDVGTGRLPIAVKLSTSIVLSFFHKF